MSGKICEERDMSLRTIRRAAGFLSLSTGLLLAANQANAHPQLVSAEPAADSSIAAPTMIVLHFNESLETRISSLKVTDLDGAEVAIMPMAALDDQSLAAMPNAPLAPGLYTVSWTAAGADGHPMHGSLSFTVK
jgi:hypothetical protein